MFSSQAPQQMLGYVYQMRYALFLLLKDENPQAQVAIEKFDDISVETDAGSQINYQLKHHNLQTGTLTDASTDLWKTIYNWIKLVEGQKELLDTTTFVIITTDKVSPNSAASYLAPDERKRDERKAKEILQQVASSSHNTNHNSYYQTFKKCESAMLDSLLAKIYILAQEPSVINIKSKLMDFLKYGSTPRYQEKIFERIEGWWFNKVVLSLSQSNHILPNQSEVRGFIARARDEFAEDNLPIDINVVENIEETLLKKEEKIFIEQLKLIGIGRNKIKLAIQDYYRALAQRGNWTRAGLLYVDELENYENRLVDEWEHLFCELLDESSLMEENEETKQIKGKELFKKIEQLDIRIRERCREAFIMRGSYHQLSNQLRVGWHIEFEDRMKKILEDFKENICKSGEIAPEK